MKLNVGSGSRSMKGFINMDINRGGNSDVLGDVKHMPFRKNAFDYIYCHHVLEHVEGSLVGIMEGFWDALKDRGTLEIHVPHFMHVGAWGHPEHVRTFNFATFGTFEVLNNEGISATRKARCRYKMVRKEFKYRETDHTGTKPPLMTRPFIWAINKAANAFPQSFDRYWGYWVGGCEEIIVEMEAVK